MKLNFLKPIRALFSENEMKEDIQKFISLNKRHWVDINGSSQKGYILVDGMKISAAYFAVASRAVKSIEESTGCLPIVLLDTFSFYSNFWKKIYGSYNINNFLYLKDYYFKINFIVKALILSLNFFINKKNVEDLLRLKFKEICIGDLIYDNILRFNKGLYTIDGIKLKYFKYFFLAFWRAMIYEEIFSKHDIKYTYACLPVFISGGVLARVADQRGATVILASRKLMKNYKGLDVREGKYRPRKSDVEALKKINQLYKDIEDYFDRRFAGEVNELDVIKSYKDKTEYNKEDLIKKLGLDKNKPVVFIMAHAFSDGPHHTPTEGLLFKDYYVWLEETIKGISEIKNANWVVKPHPMSFKYGEEGEVEKMVASYGKNNVHIAPNNLNTKSIKDLADAIITVQGKSGLEFSCFGVPAIITSQAPYSGFGVTMEPKTIAEYFNLLQNINTVSKLSEDQIRTAKVLAAILFLYSRTNDPLFPSKENVLYLRYNEEARWKQNSTLMQKYNRNEDEFFQRVKDLLNMNLYRKYLS